MIGTNFFFADFKNMNNHDLFAEKKFPTLLRGFLDFLQSKNAFALGIPQNIKNRQNMSLDYFRKLNLGEIEV